MTARFRSLDVFRGATVALMILVNNPGTWSAIYPPLAHALLARLDAHRPGVSVLPVRGGQRAGAGDAGAAGRVPARLFWRRVRNARC
jgi:hypothetical protein